MHFFHFFNKKILYVISSFIAGFSIMVVELISARIVAPIIGASVFTWTSVIGLTLLGLAIGGWVGGRVADRSKSNTPLPLAFLFSSIFVGLIPKLAEHTDFLTNFSNSILLLNIYLATYLFFLPAIAIGTIQPLLLKQYADVFSDIGSRYGNLSAVWSIGSMLGVFLTGFFFIATIGSAKTIWSIAALLFLLGMVYALTVQKLLPYFLIALGGIATLYFIDQPPQKNAVLHHEETNYYDIRVMDTSLPSFGSSRILLLDFDIHSINSSNTRKLTYTSIHPFFSFLKKDLHHMLVLGAGAYTLPKHLREYYPESTVTVVEMDPQIETISKKYFDLERYGIETVATDAKLFIQKNTETYDLIFGDAYNSFISVPWYLLTHEWNTEVKARLNEGGIYAINFIGALDGDGSAFTKSVLRTFTLSFPNSYVLAFGKSTTDIQNIVLVGIQGELPLTESELIQKITSSKHRELAGLITSKDSISFGTSSILSNDFSPVEKLMDPIIKAYFPKYLTLLKEIVS